MSTRSALQPPVPAARAMADSAALSLGAAIAGERQHRGWATRELAARARVTPSTVSNVEAGRRASMDVYARLAVALGLTLDVSLTDKRRRRIREPSDLVHAAMGEYWARRLHDRGYEVAIDHPYQHYQFAGRADVLAWTRDPAALLHIENRTRFPDLQQAAGSYNAKRQYLARVVADQLGIGHFDSETHVMAGLWSAEVIHSLRLRPATFRALCPDPVDHATAWLEGTPPARSATSTFLLLDPFARGRMSPMVGLEDAIARARPRVRGYREAVSRLGR